MKKYIYSTISFVVFAVPSVIFIFALLAEVIAHDPINSFLGSFFAQLLDHSLVYMCLDAIVFGLCGGEGYIIFDFMHALAVLNIFLLVLTYVYIIILDVIRISIHWLIKSGVFVGFVFLTNYLILNPSFDSEGYFLQGEILKLNIYTTIYYLTMFLIILVVKNWLSKKHV